MHGGDRDPIRSLPDEVLEMPGRSILQSLQALGGVIRIVHANMGDLVRWIDRTISPDVLVRVWNANERTHLDDHLDEAERLLFNVVAAAHARVDFYRAAVNRDHVCGQLLHDYRQRLGETIGKEPLHDWFMVTRNFILHQSLPVLRGGLEITGTKASSAAIKSSVLINVKRMLDSTAFNSRAKSWMRATNEIDLRESVVTYRNLLDEFDSWFGAAYVGFHLDACESFLQELDVARAELYRARIEAATNAWSERSGG